MIDFEKITDCDVKMRERLLFLFELIACSHDRLDYWFYGADGQFLTTNAREEYLFELFFSRGKFKQTAIDHGREHSAPLLISSLLGNLYAVVYARSKDKVSGYHVLGPLFTDTLSEKALSRFMSEFPLPPAFAPRFLRGVRQFPVIPWTDFNKYVVMLHYAVTGESISSGDFSYHPKDLALLSSPGEILAESESPSRNQSRPWLAEQALLNNVRDGNLNFKPALAKAGLVSSGVQVDTGEPLQRARITSSVFTALCARAAIQGGLPPQTAYHLQNTYSQRILNAAEFSQIVDINHQMYEDYILRVHRLQQKSGISPQIRNCMDYIEMHPYQKISISELADLAGYTDYYLSRKFKQEAGCSPHDYILEQKMRAAKSLLTSTTLDIQEISEQLQFCSRSYFTDNFRRLFGISPTEYRRKNQRI